jgi:hypothetical protein
VQLAALPEAALPEPLADALADPEPLADALAEPEPLADALPDAALPDVPDGLLAAPPLELHPAIAMAATAIVATATREIRTLTPSLSVSAGSAHRSAHAVLSAGESPPAMHDRGRGTIGL